jgi:hypothetical protein
MGEAKHKREMSVKEMGRAIGVETMHGRIQVKWDTSASATPFGQMAFFIEFLKLTGLYERWIEGCPLRYAGPNGSPTADILGTWFLSILSGHRRYAHITTLRADGVLPELLGMSRIVSEDTVRRGLKAIEDEPGHAWCATHLDASVWPLLSAPWIMDIDVTVKPLFGHQECAEIGYNPTKPGRPPHTCHSYLMAGLRLVLDVNVEAGNKSQANTTLPGLVELLDRMPPDKRPRCVRGDCGFGQDATMRALEDRQIPYLFKLKLTKNVKRYLQQILWSEGWQDAGQGWEGREGRIKLTGWQDERRIIALRRLLLGDVLLSTEATQLELAFVASDRPDRRYEYAVLVTDLPYDVCALAQLYRDRADAENVFDELKNQWGWGGYMTHDIKRCRLTAEAVALIYNWWSLFVRLANPDARLEAITSRPFLLSGVARKTEHAGQKHLKITPLHGKNKKASDMLTRVSALLQEWKKTAEQFDSTAVWRRVCQTITTAFTGIDWLAPRQNVRVIPAGVG